MLKEKKEGNENDVKQVGQLDNNNIIKETRAGGTVGAAEVETPGERNVSGYAHQYGNVYEYKAWYPNENLEWDYVTIREIFDVGAFNGARKERAYFRHNHDMKARGLAHARNNSLALSADNMGLAFDANLSDTNAGNDLHTDIKSGLTTEMSFAFAMNDTDQTAVQYTRISDDVVERRIKKVEEIFDVSTVDYPAFTGTSIDAKSDMKKLENGQEDQIEKRNVLPGLASFIAGERAEAKATKDALDLQRNKLQCKIRINNALN